MALTKTQSLEIQELNEKLADKNQIILDTARSLKKVARLKITEGISLMEML